MDNFLNGLKFSTIAPMLAKELDSPLDINTIIEVTNSKQSGKAI